MAQSMVTIYKLVGQESVRRYGSAACGAKEPKELLRLLESEVPGPKLLYKTKHYDPTSIAIIDVLQHRFPHLSQGHLGRRCTDEDVDILTATLSPKNLPEAMNKMNYNGSNVDEMNLLLYLVRMAVSFWSDALVINNIDSILVVSVEKLSPSLLTDDVIRAAKS